MKEVDRIKIVDHFDFELFFEGSHFGCNFQNGWSRGYLFTHKVKLKELLELDKDTHYEFEVLLVLKPHIFHIFSYNFYFLNYKFFICSILSKERNVDLMKKHGFYYMYFILFWVYDKSNSILTTNFV